MPLARYVSLLAAALALGACATIPDELAGDYPGPDPGEATPADVGAGVRWGGRLLGVTPEAERSCFEILSRPLTDIARPTEDERRAGRRFLACREGFVDPAAHQVDADVTVVGTLSGFETRAIGDYDYRYPVVRARAVHVWPQPRELDPDPLPPPSWWYHDRYWRPHPWYW